MSEVTERIARLRNWIGNPHTSSEADVLLLCDEYEALDRLVDAMRPHLAVQHDA